MIRVQYMPVGSRSGIVRAYERDNAAPLEDYLLVCTLNWDENCPNKDVWVHALMGEGNRRFLRQLVQQVHSMGFLRIRALRKEGHLLPKATEMPDGSLMILVSDFIKTSELPVV